MFNLIMRSLLVDKAQRLINSACVPFAAGSCRRFILIVTALWFSVLPARPAFVDGKEKVVMCIAPMFHPADMRSARAGTTSNHSKLF